VDQFPDLIRGVGVGKARDKVFAQLAEMLSRYRSFSDVMYLLASGIPPTRAGEALHVEHCYEFLLEEIDSRQINQYIPKGSLSSSHISHILLRSTRCSYGASLYTISIKESNSICLIRTQCNKCAARFRFLR
jgi:hypothetical protein